ncbi:SGNH/GDSL hydrolase family protein [Tateyamaria armeniaca]|uniref:SGNH/GDSL hydrolase family protein n=1 Tax=Tateyamaria armeniaca TaxID=2518930 RepID=A0ABW8UTR0_9RHOB
MPLIVSQGLWVAARATRLPEAAGPRQGQSGQGTPLRLLILGDSSAAGVGVDHQDNALSGRLVARLAATHSVDWHLWARSGLTTSSALRLLAAQETRAFDIAVLALGVNDVKNGVHLRRWQTNYQRLIAVLRTRLNVRQIYASGVPPLGSFPLLPDPLRSVLGARADRFDAALGAICAGAGHAHHLAFDIPLDPQFVAADGFHPSAVLYDIWAAQVAAAIHAHPLTSAAP